MDSRTAFVIDPTGADIHAEAARLRTGGAVVPIELPGGVRAWSVVGYEAGRRVLADDRFSKDARRHWPAYREGRIAPDFPLIVWARMQNLSTSHGAEHTRLRRQVLTAFTPRRVQTLRPVVQRTVDRLLDALAAAPGQVVDLKAQFAHPLAATVIADLIGVPEADRPGLFGGGYAGADGPPDPAAAAAAFAQVRHRMEQLVAARRHTPADDLVTDLLAAQADAAVLTDDEIVQTLLLLVNTGTEPAMNLVANAIRALLTHPDQLARVRSGRSGWDEVIEETLRVEAPVAHLPFRFPVEDVEVDGTVIPRGEPVLMHFAAMGRDPEVHGADAGRFDPTRADKRHLSFGHGSYRCIGSSLAWLEAELALDGLFGRFPQLRLAEPADELGGPGTFIMHGPRQLPVYCGGPAQID